MIVSTRGRYALHVLMYLAEHRDEGYIPLKDVAERVSVSHKYAESIMGELSRAGLVDGVHGRGGGYRLNRPPAAYSLGEVLRITEGNLAPVSCLERDASPCGEAERCKTLPVWEQLYRLVNDYLDSVSLADILDDSGGGPPKAC